MAPNLRIVHEIANPNEARQHDGDNLFRVAIGAAQRRRRETLPRRSRPVRNDEASRFGYHLHLILGRAIEQLDVFEILPVVRRRTSYIGIGSMHCNTAEQ